MESRTYATGKIQWPNVELIVTSPPFPSFAEYVADYFDPDEIINIMVGDLERIKEYPKQGFQTEQSIPTQVWKAYESLVAAGYTKHILL